MDKYIIYIWRKLNLNNKYEVGTKIETKNNDTTLYNYLEEVGKNVSIEDGNQAIEKVLINIYFKEGISTKELSRNNLLPIPVVSAIKKEFIKFGLLIQDRGVRLTPKGRCYVEEVLGFKGLNKELYMRLLKEPWKEHKEIAEVKEILSEIFINRPQADVTIDQSKCTVDTALRRAVLTLINHVLIGKKILCLGDDDLISIAIGLLLKKLFSNVKYSKTTVLVMDIDKRFLSYIEDIAEKEELPIKCEYTDLRLPISKDYRDSFDCCFTDPPYTLEGMNLFVSRGVEALKKEKGIPIFLSFAHKSPDFELTMQECFVRMGLIVSKITTAFNSYEGAGIIGNSSQMIILKTTSKSTSSIETSYKGAIYTGELRVTVRHYKCKECGEIIKVGASESFKTIEELKEKGCIKCKNQIFDRLPGDASNRETVEID